MQDLLFGIGSYIHFLQYPFSDIVQYRKLQKKTDEILLLVIMETAIFCLRKIIQSLQTVSYIHIVF